MAAVLASAGVFSGKHEGDVETIFWVSPSSMDSADTVDLTAKIDGRSVMSVSCWDRADGADATITGTATTFTLDAAGSATNSVYVVRIEVMR